MTRWEQVLGNHGLHGFSLWGEGRNWRSACSFLGRRATRNRAAVALRLRLGVWFWWLLSAWLVHGTAGVLVYSAVMLLRAAMSATVWAAVATAMAARLLVFAPGFVNGLDLLGKDVGWLALGSGLFDMRLGVVDAPAEQLERG